MIYKFIIYCLLIIPFTSFCQPLSSGMAVITMLGAGGGTGNPGNPNNTYNSFSIFEATNNQNAPTGQNWFTNFYFPSNPNYQNSWKSSVLGELFGIAIDSNKNIYFTAGFWGTTYFQIGVAGSGGVYKMDNQTWEVSPFITTGNGPNQIPNFAEGLGNIVYDKWNNQLFISNMNDGKIYRFRPNGVLLSVYDPFLPDASSPFDFCGYGEAVFGLGINMEEKLYLYFSKIVEDTDSVNLTENNSIWKIEIGDGGDFNGNEIFCFEINDYNQSNSSHETNPISDIVFTSEGDKMYITEKGIQSVWSIPGQTIHVFEGVPHCSRVFEYIYDFQLMEWNLSKQFFIGNYDKNNNTNGGVTLGSRKINGSIQKEELLWVSGSALRHPSYNDFPGAYDYVYGATAVPSAGNSLVPVLPNYVQTSSIYVDIQTFGANNTPILKGQYGDIEIYENFQNFVTIDYPNVNERTLIKTIDVLGRETDKNKNQTLFYIYDDGTVEKKIIIE